MKFSTITFLCFCSIFFLQCAPEQKPNILFILADDHRADAIAAYGNTQIQTPNIDRIIHNGFSFSNTYVMGSHHGAVCAPSRSMMLTGKSLYHVYANLDTVEILPQFLQEAGYTTFATGKYHTDNYQSTELDFKGFDHGKTVMFGGMSDHNKVPVRDQISYGKFTDKEVKGFSSEIFTEATIDFLTSFSKAESENPFYAYVSYTAPHDPRTPPGKFLNMYDPDEITLPKNYLEIHPFHTGWMTGRDEILTGWPREEQVIKEQLAEYYGLISHMDEQIGRILTTLEELGQLKNTIVIFAADHGLAMGSHGLLGKQNLYEHSTKAPLVFMGPGVPKNQSSDAFVYLLDIFGSIASLAHATTPSNRESLDLTEAWTTNSFAGRPYMYNTYEDIQRSIRQGDWKLIRYPKIHHNQLFNLKDDPNEMNNLASRPEQKAKIAELMTLLSEAQKHFDDPHPLTSDSLESMVFDPSDFVRKVDRHQPQWVIDKYFK